MKARDIYSSYTLVAGFLLLILGVGNWVAGAIEITKYQNLLRKTAETGLEESYRSFQELDQQKNEEVLRRINEDRERYNAARVKMDFYYVVLSGGRFLFVIGGLLTFFSLIRLIRQDTLVKIRKLGSQTAEE
jgi:hypothetical protein